MDEFASYALLTAVFGVVPVSIPLAVVGLRRTKGRRRAGRGRAIVSVVLSGIWIVLIATGLVYYESSGLPLNRWSNPNATRVEGSDLRSEQCVDVPLVLPRRQTWFNVVDCSIPHNAEVVRSRCDAELVAFSGSTNSKLSVDSRHVGKAGWNAGHGYVCLAVSDDTVTGTMVGTG